MEKEHKIEKAVMKFFMGGLWSPLDIDTVYEVKLWGGDRYLFYYATDVKDWVWGDKCKN